MINTFGNLQPLGPSNIGDVMQLWNAWSRNWQAIAVSMGDYSKRSFEEGTATFHKLMDAKNLEQAVMIQSDYAKRAAEQYFQELNKLGGICAGLPQTAVKPNGTKLNG
jgi:hypothetical protein